MSEATTLHKKWVDKQNTRYGLRGFGEASGVHGDRRYNPGGWHWYKQRDLQHRR
jgi:hypothetical protein